MRIQISRDITPFLLSNGYRRVEGLLCLHFQRQSICDRVSMVKVTNASMSIVPTSSGYSIRLLYPEDGGIRQSAALFQNPSDYQPTITNVPENFTLEH